MHVRQAGTYSLQRVVVAALLAALALGVAFALPSTAHAATFSNVVPAAGTTLTASPPVVSASATHTSPILGTPVVTLDGVAYPATGAYALVRAGYWYYDPEDGVDYWIAPVYDYTRIVVTCTPPVLTDGQHSATIALPGTAGSTTWSFGVAEKPVFGAVTPVSGTTVNTTTPAVSAKVTDNGAVSTWSATVDGAPVSSAYSAATKTITLSPSELANFTGHTVAVTVTDAGGNSASKTWAFNVNAPVSTFSGETPPRGALITTTAPQILMARVACTSDLQPANRRVTLDGVTRPSPGWIGAVPPDPKAGTVFALGSGITDGDHTVTVAVPNTGGTTSTTSWGFSVRIAPVIGTPTPAPGSTVTTDRPSIEVPASDNEAVASVEATVNGARVSATFDAAAKTLRVSAPSALPDDTTTTVSVAVTDRIGLRTEKTFSFLVQASPALAGSSSACADCHADKYDGSHEITTCSHCHPGHSGTPSQLHARADVSTCSPCHKSQLVIEHNRPGLSCATCHDSTDPKVKAAISSRSSECSGCHGLQNSGHLAMHETDTAALTLPGFTAVCGDCHDSNLMTEHAKLSASSAAAGCDACHPNPRISVGVLDRTTCVQAGCHVPGTPTQMHGGTVTGHASPTTCIGTCHSATLDVEHAARSVSCQGCHASTDAAVKAAFISHDRTCSACHGADHATTAAFCGSCHSGPNGTYGGATTFSATKHGAVGASSVALTQYPGTSYGSGSCANCHGSHTATPRAAGNTLCYNCHDGAGTTKPSTYSYRSASSFGSSGHGVSSDAAACGSCHAVHGAKDASGTLVAAGLTKAEPTLCTGTAVQPGCHAQPAKSKNGTNILAAFSAGADSLTRHDVYATTGTHVVCSNCHNPHKDSGTVEFSNPQAIGSALPNATDRFRDASGNVYALVGAQHDAAPPVISSLSLWGSVSSPTTRYIQWYTDEPATGVFEYGPTTAYGSQIVTNYGADSYYHANWSVALPVGTTWHWRVRSTDALGNTAVSADSTYRVPWTFLVTSATVAGGDSGTPVVMNWKTLGECESWVDYGPTTAYGSVAGSASNVTSHTVTLSSLPSGTYHMRARSVRDGDVYASPDMIVYVTQAGLPSSTLTPIADNVNAAASNPTTFTWTQPDIAGAPYTYDLHVWSTSGYDQRLNGLTTTTQTLDLPEGYFQWQVIPKDKNGIMHPMSAVDDFTLQVYVDPATSCPDLYAWNGEGYQYVTDVMGLGSLGLRVGGNALRYPLAVEDSRIDPSLVKADGGVYKLQLRENRDELDYVDNLSLKVIDHPVGTNVFLSDFAGAHATDSRPQLPPNMPYVVSEDLTPVRSASYTCIPLFKGLAAENQDITQQVAREDSTFAPAPVFDDTRYTFDLGDQSKATSIRLVMTGWTQYGSPAEKAEWRAMGAPTPERVMEVMDADGNWKQICEVAPFIPGMKKTVVYDLTGKFPEGVTQYKVRLRGFVRTWIDYVGVDNTENGDMKVTELSPSKADLSFVGGGERKTVDGYPMYTWESSGERFFHAGNYTRYGDVKPLLAGSDDKYVIMDNGDSIALEFPELAPPAEGMERTYVLHTDGYFNERADASVSPLPFHAMSNYPYGSGEHYPDDADHQAYLAEWNTRVHTKTGAVDDSPMTSFLDAVRGAFEWLSQAVTDTFAPDSAGNVARTTVAPVSVAAAPAVSSSDRAYSIDTDMLKLNVTYASSVSGLSPLAAWESAGSIASQPTPASPGTAVSGAVWNNGTSVNGLYWRTELNPADRNYNWQLSRFNVPSNMLTNATGLQLVWSGHGEPTPSYPVKMYLWDFQASKWVLAAESAGGTDFSLSHTEHQAGGQTFCLSCHQDSPPQGSAGVSSYANINAAWGKDAHGDRSGTGFGGSIAAPYSRGNIAIECGVCHDSHGSSNTMHLKNSINGTAVSVTSAGSQYQNACLACHVGTVASLHEQCRSCHQDGTDHTYGPTIDGTWNCASCHKHGAVWAHPSEGCHGCGDPEGMAWNAF